MAILHNLSGMFGAPFHNGDTISLDYPDGTVQADFTDSDGHTWIVNQKDFQSDDDEFTLSFDASAVVLTNATGKTFGTGSVWSLQLKEFEETTGKLLARASGENGDQVQETEIGAGLILSGRTLSLGGNSDIHVPAGGSIAAAVVKAISRSPSASNPIVIHVEQGVFAEDAINISSAYISIVGSGINSTVIQPTGTNAVTISAANVHLSNLTISRATGGNAAFVLTMTGTTFATYKDDIVLTNVLVRNNNTSGAAIATCVARTKGCRVEATGSGGTGIEQVYGGIHDNLEVVAGKYAIRYAQSAMELGSHPFADMRPVLFNTPHLVQTDVTGGHVIQGLVESETMNQVTTGTVNWAAPKISGGLIHSACELIANPAATSEAFRGFIHLFGVDIEGDRWTTYWVGSYANACYWSAQNPAATTLMSGVSTASITGGSMIAGCSTKVISLSNSMVNGVTFESDMTKMIGSDQWYLDNCTDYQAKIATGDGRIGSVRNDLAALVDSTSYLLETADTTDFNLSTMTIECWVKLKSSSTTGALLNLPSSTEAGFLIVIERSNNRIYGGFNPPASAYLDSSACSALFGSNTTSGPYSDGWHHVAMTLSGGTQRLWLDGTEKHSAAGATPSPTSGRLIIGGYNNANLAGSALSLYAQGMITGVRVSNIVRYATGNTYTTTTLKKRWEPDADTLGLWSDTTTGPLLWEDKMRSHSITISPNANVTVPWVRQSYTP